MRVVRPSALAPNDALVNRAKDASRLLVEGDIEKLRALVVQHKDAVLPAIDPPRVAAANKRKKDAAAKRELENEKNRQAMIKSRLYRALKADDIRRLAEEWGEPTSYNGKNVTAQTLAQNLAAREGFNEKDADDFIERMSKEQEEEERISNEEEAAAKAAAKAANKKEAAAKAAAKAAHTEKEKIKRLEASLAKLEDTNIQLGIDRIDAIQAKQSAEASAKLKGEELAQLQARLANLEAELALKPKDDDDKPKGKGVKRERGRSRSRSPGRDLSRSHSCSHGGDRDRSRGRDRDRSRGRDRDNSRGRGRSHSRSRSSSHSRGRDRNRDRDRLRGRDRDRSHDRGRSRGRDRDRSHSRGRDRDRSRSQDRDRDRSRGRDRDRDRSRGRDRDRDRSRGRDRDRDRPCGRDSDRDCGHSRGMVYIAIPGAARGRRTGGMQFAHAVSPDDFGYQFMTPHM